MPFRQSSDTMLGWSEHELASLGFRKRPNGPTPPMVDGPTPARKRALPDADVAAGAELHRKRADRIVRIRQATQGHTESSSDDSSSEFAKRASPALEERTSPMCLPSLLHGGCLLADPPPAIDGFPVPKEHKDGVLHRQESYPGILSCPADGTPGFLVDCTPHKDEAPLCAFRPRCRPTLLFRASPACETPKLTSGQAVS
jgi:hypothetical protein